eukprot:3559587-Rhodomonas_salina.1
MTASVCRWERVNAEVKREHCGPLFPNELVGLECHCTYEVRSGAAYAISTLPSHGVVSMGLNVKGQTVRNEGH